MQWHSAVTRPRAFLKYSTSIFNRILRTSGGAVAVMALERVPADIRKQGAVGLYVDLLEQIRETIGCRCEGQANATAVGEALAYRPVRIGGKGFSPAHRAVYKLARNEPFVVSGRDESHLRSPIRGSGSGLGEMVTLGRMSTAPPQEY